MPAERYYHPELLEIGQQIHLKDQEHHHLVTVMRSRLGDKIEIVNGKGQLAHATVGSVEKKQSVLHIDSVESALFPSERLILAQGIPRQNRLEFILEKGTELGMTEIWLFPAQRSEKKDFSENQLERFHTLIIAAMKQCGRLYLPKIRVMPPLKQWKNVEVPTLFFGDTTPSAPSFASLCKTIDPIQEAVFCIGPESGFTEDEMEILHNLHAKGIKLHPNILRTDTAAIAGLALLSHQIYFPKDS